MGNVFIATDDDGSQWVMLSDYQALQQKYLLGELALEEQIKRNSALLQATGLLPFDICAGCRQNVAVDISECPYCGCHIIYQRIGSEI